METDDPDNQISEKYKERIETVNCPYCKTGKIVLSFISGWIEWRVSRISAGAKRTKFYHDPKTVVHSKCPNCGATKKEIKDALETGNTEKISHEERLKRIRESGLPTTIEFKVS